MTALIALCSLITSWFTGTHEGQTQCKPLDYMHRGMPKRYWDDKDNYQNMVFDFSDLGTRGHVWFRWYHAIAVGMRLSWEVLGMLFILIAVMPFIPHDYWLYIGWLDFGVISLSKWLWLILLSYVIINDSYEYAYSYSRFKVWINPYAEHFNIADIFRWHWGSKFAHTVRVALVAIMVATALTG